MGDDSGKPHPFKGATPEALARALMRPRNALDSKDRRSGANERRRVGRRDSGACPEDS